MERVIAAVMCAGLVLLLFVGLGWADTNSIVNITDDTFIWLDVNATKAVCNNGQDWNFSTDANYGNNNTVLNLFFKADSQPYNLKSYYKFNITSIQSKVIKNITLMSYKNYSSCGAGTTTKPIYYLNNDTWNETGITGLNAPAGEIVFGTLRIATPSTTYKSDNLMNGSAFANDVYTDNFTTLVIGKDHSPFPGCAAAYNSVCSRSDEDNSFGSWFNVTLVDYLSGNISLTDLTGFCLDFESGIYNDTVSSISDCTGSTWDFFYDLTTNKITPIEPIAFAGRTTADSNASLGYLDCNLFGPSAYTYNQYSNANPPSTPKLYDMFCFNQSYVHAVKGFYGAIKIINNTNVRYSLECPLNDCHDLDLYWAIYSPAFATFSLPVLQPDPPIGGVNLTVQWTTTIPMYGGVYFRYNASGNMSSYFTIYDSNLSYRNYHSVVIPASYILSYKYEYYLIGNSSTGTNYTSIMFNFTALGVTEIITENTTIAGPDGALQRLVDNGFVENYEQAKWFLGGLVLLILGGFSVYFGGMKIGITSIALLALALGTVGLLPGYVMAPIIFLAAVVVVSFLSGVFT